MVENARIAAPDYTTGFRGLVMNDQFYKERAKVVREIAGKADPFIKKRLLDLANRYDSKPRSPTPLPPIQVAQDKQERT